LNRWLQQRFAVDVVTEQGVLPAFQPRDDADRAARQRALADRLGVALGLVNAYIERVP
jgi:hypothetical protein